jgi:hypothetical protein
LREQPPEGNRATPVPAELGRDRTPAYDYRRYPDAAGGPIAVVRVKVNVTFHHPVTLEHAQYVWEKAQQATDHVFNRGHRLLSGDRILVDLVHTPDPAAANLHIHVSDRPGPWHPKAHPDAVVQDLRAHLGLPREPIHQDLSPQEIRQLSNDIAKANTPFTRADLAAGRVIGIGNLKVIEKPEYQHAVEDAVRAGDRFLVHADPHRYAEYINDGGPSKPGRGNDCNDCTLALLSTHNGRPMVAAARWPDELPDGSIDDHSGERAGPHRAEAWIGGTWQNY